MRAKVQKKYAPGEQEVNTLAWEITMGRSLNWQLRVRTKWSRAQASVQQINRLAFARR